MVRFRDRDDFVRDLMGAVGEAGVFGDGIGFWLIAEQVFIAGWDVRVVEVVEVVKHELDGLGVVLGEVDLVLGLCLLGKKRVSASVSALARSLLSNTCSS